MAILGLVPLALGAGQTGKEILHPLAIVVIGGLLDSTLMDQIVTPAVFYLFGRRVCAKQAKPDADLLDAPWDDACIHEPPHERNGAQHAGEARIGSSLEAETRATSVPMSAKGPGGS